MQRDSGFARDLILGALAGALATRAMDRVTTSLYDIEDRQARERERQVFEKPAYEVAAARLAGLVGLSPTEADPRRAGRAIHRARGLAGRLAYGPTAETTLDLLDRAA